MKVLNVFGIIFAWILSIAMVIMLVAAPLALSTLSLLEPENIVELVSQALLENNKSAAAQPLEGYAVQKLSVETDAATEEKPATENAVGGIKLDGIQGIVGNDVSEEMLIKVLTSDAMSELLGAYTKDFTNAIAGKNEEKEFTSELLVEVVQDNLDEIVEIVEKTGATTLTDEQKAQLKNQIGTAVEEKAEEIVAKMPAPEELKKSLVEGNEEMELVFTVFGIKDAIKNTIVGMIVLVSVLIFALRFPGLRGMRWLSTNLFTAGGFNALICLTMGVGTTAVKGAVAGMNAMGGTAVDGIIGTLLAQLTKGMIIRTVIIFVAAIALLVGYILLKPLTRKNKKVNASEAEEIIPKVGPVFVPVPVAVEPEPVAEPVSKEQIHEILAEELAEKSAQPQEVGAEEPAEEPAPTEEI